MVIHIYQKFLKIPHGTENWLRTKDNAPTDGQCQIKHTPPKFERGITKHIDSINWTCANFHNKKYYSLIIYLDHMLLYDCKPLLIKNGSCMGSRPRKLRNITSASWNYTWQVQKLHSHSFYTSIKLQMHSYMHSLKACIQKLLLNFKLQFNDAYIEHAFLQCKVFTVLVYRFRPDFTSKKEYSGCPNKCG